MLLTVNETFLKEKKRTKKRFPIVNCLKIVNLFLKITIFVKNFKMQSFAVLD
jgi:hypothetical protein